MTAHDTTRRVVALRQPRAHDDTAGQAAPEAGIDGAAPSGPAARFGWWALALGFGGFLAWAALAPLDNGVTLSGTVVVTGERQAVDSLGGGVVGALLVAEGQSVQAGQTLVRLDDTRARSDAQSLRVQLAAAAARVARLLAERDGLAAFGLAPGAAADAQAAAALALERQLFDSRRAALEGELAGIRATLQGSRALAGGLEAALAYKRAQRGLLQEQLANLRELAGEGYVPRNRLLELERMQAQLAGEIAADLGSLGQARQQIAELGLRAAQRRDQFQQDVRADLAEAGVQREQLAQKLAAAEFDLAHVEIRAPAAGTVVGLAAHTVGGVVQPGARLMEIVPETAPLIVEGRLPVESVDKVQAGLPVELLFTAFDRSRTPRLAGTVALLSADRFEDDRGGHPYYRVRVEVQAGQLQRLGPVQLRAGMPVEVFVRTGERSLLNYLFKPLLDRVGLAWGDA